VKPSIQQEHYSEAICTEMLPLVQRNWRESTSYEEGLEADPDFARYKRLDDAGMCLCLTARAEGRLVGYVVFIVSTSTHHKTVLCGAGDALYLEPEFRGHAAELLRQAEQMLRARGVRRLGWPVDEGSPLRKLLKSFDFHDDEIVMEKVLQ
jgi:GNAT superfamily N-acetyltransferase